MPKLSINSATDSRLVDVLKMRVDVSIVTSTRQVEKRDLVVTGKAVWLIGRQKVKEGPDKGTMVAAVSRKIELDKILKVTHLDTLSVVLEM